MSFSLPKLETKIIKILLQVKDEVKDEVKDIKQNIVKFAINELNELFDSWYILNDNDCSGGKMREHRGSGIENIVLNIIKYMASTLKIDLIAKLGKFDKKTLILPKNNKISKKHQVDVHVYLKNIFIAVIECKSYLDSCYYVRVCDDFELFKKFDYNVKSVIFSLEDAIDEQTKNFTDFVKNHICDDVFYMLDGKRTSSKPIYNKEYRKEPIEDKMMNFISFIYNLAFK